MRREWSCPGTTTRRRRSPGLSADPFSVLGRSFRASHVRRREGRRKARLDQCNGSRNMPLSPCFGARRAFWWRVSRLWDDFTTTTQEIVHPPWHGHQGRPFWLVLANGAAVQAVVIDLGDPARKWNQTDPELSWSKRVKPLSRAAGRVVRQGRSDLVYRKPGGTAALPTCLTGSGILDDSQLSGAGRDRRPRCFWPISCSGCSPPGKCADLMPSGTRSTFCSRW